MQRRASSTYGPTKAWQRQVDEQFGQKEIAAGLAVEQQGVLADPAKPGLFGQGLFQNWRAVDEGSVAKGANGLLDAVGQRLHTLAHQLVVVPAQGIAGHVGLLRLGQALRHLRVAGQIVHAQRDDAHGAWDQLLGVGALAAVRPQVFHLPLITGVQPALQVVLVFAQVDTGDADVGKAQFLAPQLDVVGQCVEVRCGGGHGWASNTGRGAYNSARHWSF